jgi:hypothetical protein
VRLKVFAGFAGGLSSGRTLDPLFGAGALEDVVAIAEADRGTYEALLLPQPLDLFLELVELGGRFGVVTLGERMVKLGAPVARPLDLFANLLESLHNPANVVGRKVFPKSHQLIHWNEKYL